jgi:hypothetical protein
VPRAHQTYRYRTLFLSDLHLGTRGCQAHLILDMLRHVEADTIYLVGDIIDGWRLRITTSSRNCCARLGAARGWCSFPATTMNSPVSSSA